MRCSTQMTRAWRGVTAVLGALLDPATMTRRRMGLKTVDGRASLPLVIGSTDRTVRRSRTKRKAKADSRAARAHKHLRTHDLPMNGTSHDMRGRWMGLDEVLVSLSRGHLLDAHRIG